MEVSDSACWLGQRWVAPVFAALSTAWSTVCCPCRSSYYVKEGQNWRTLAIPAAHSMPAGLTTRSSFLHPSPGRLVSMLYRCADLAIRASRKSADALWQSVLGYVTHHFTAIRYLPLKAIVQLAFQIPTSRTPQTRRESCQPCHHTRSCGERITCLLLAILAIHQHH